MHETVTIETRDGQCPAHVFTPEGAGPWPAVIFFMDGLGIRQTLFDMGQRLADGGYVVLLPDMFYRAGPYPEMNPMEILGGGGSFREKMGHLFSSIDNRKASQDTEAFLAYLDTRSDIAGKKVGATGYCMGGAMSLWAAGTYPDRIAAAASYHGGNLAFDGELSPHLLAPKMKARVYVAGADKDDSYPVEMEARLDKALNDAGVEHTCEIYPGALHGWTMKDFPIYDEAAGERHWQTLLDLYGATLH